MGSHESCFPLLREVKKHIIVNIQLDKTQNMCTKFGNDCIAKGDN